jgi:hypothetical protein
LDRHLREFFIFTLRNNRGDRHNPAKHLRMYVTVLMLTIGPRRMASS